MVFRKPIDWNELNQRVVACRRCTRLRAHCAAVAKEKRRAYLGWDYWGRPVKNFGDSQARLLLVGLAPGAHGANRTGRMFTGDCSGDWLYRALHRARFANQAKSTDIQDGMKLTNCAITAIGHCVPPQNKLSRDEIDNCYPFLEQTVALLPVRVFLVIGTDSVAIRRSAGV